MGLLFSEGEGCSFYIKSKYYGGALKKLIFKGVEDTRQFAELRGGGVFLKGGLIPQCTLSKILKARKVMGGMPLGILGIILGISDCSSVYNKLLRNQQIIKQTN